jgi:hypothetical protein
LVICNDLRLKCDSSSFIFYDGFTFNLIGFHTQNNIIVFFHLGFFSALVM